MTTDNAMLENQEIEAVKSQLDILNIKYHPRAGYTTLRNLLNDALSKQEEVKSVEVSKRSLEKSVKAQALKPVLCKITCLNPAKATFYGDKFYFGNSVTGKCCDFIPYSRDGEAQPIWVAKMLVEILKNKRFLRVTKLPHNQRTITGENFIAQWLPEFVVEVLKEHEAPSA